MSAWEFLVEIEERVRKLLKHIVEAKALIGEELKRKSTNIFPELI